MPRKKPAFGEEEKVEKYEEYWDFKKILIGIVTLLLTVVLTVVGDVIVMHWLSHEPLTPKSFIPDIPKFTQVKGVETGPTSAPIRVSIPSAQDVQNQIQDIQQQVTHIDIKDIASSSPQVQAVLKQIQSLPAQGQSQVKDACMRLCNNL